MSMGAVLFRTDAINVVRVEDYTSPAVDGVLYCWRGLGPVFPLTSGFVSKSMIITAAASEGYWVVWVALLCASAGVFLRRG